MEESNNKYWDLLAKYLQDEASEQEKADLFAWIHAHPENKALFDKASTVWKVTAPVEDTYEPDVEKGWKQFQFKARISQNDLSGRMSTGGGTTQAKTARIVNWQPLLRIAAAIVIFVGVIYLASLYLTREEPMVDFYAAEAKKEMLLPDGSRIVLNKNSKVSYAPNFNKNERVIHLTGEAFFDVKKVDGKTFTIYSGNTVTQVLGTSFTVRAYQEEGVTEVQVLTGKVSFSTREDAGNKKVLLTPGYKGVLSKNNSISKSAINDPNFLAWKDNKLAFNNTRMERVISTLEKYFDVPIEVSNPQLLECRFTGTFESPELQEIIDVLVISVDLVYSREGNKYILSGQGCNK